jgi:hypothetical protein
MGISVRVGVGAHEDSRRNFRRLILISDAGEYSRARLALLFDK